MKIQSIFFSLIFVLIITLAEKTNAEKFEFVHDQELDKVLENIFGGFDYSTSPMNDCKFPYDKINEAINNGVFNESKHYLANAYVHQGMLGSCLMQNLTDEEAMKESGPILKSFQMAQELVPDWEVPYAMLGNYYRSLGNYTNSVADFREAENFLIKALLIAPTDENYQQMLLEVQQNLPEKERNGNQMKGNDGVKLFPSTDTVEQKNRPYLGVAFSTVPDEFRNSILEYKNSVYIQEVYPDSPAQLAGINKGDFVIKIDDRRIENAEQLRDYIAKLSVGTKPKLTILRLYDVYPTLKVAPELFNRTKIQEKDTNFKPIPFE